MNAIIKAYTLSECMELMAEYAEAYERLGGENLIFCEDRLTLIAERALVTRLGGSFHSSVSTFARLLRAQEKTVSKQGSVMLVGEVMTRLQREGALQCFTSSVGVAKNARYIYETLAQFAASQITPDVLKESLALLPEEPLKKKISDLTLIYEGYLQALLSQGYLDESRYLTLLPKRIREEGVLKGKNVFFLGYASFTAQAQETVRAAIETADNVVGIFCADDKELYTNRAAETFAKVCKEFGSFRTVDKGTPLFGDAERLRCGLFNPVRTSPPAETDALYLFEAEDKTAEAEFVATKIKRAMAENDGLRYRDFAVLAPTVEEYALPLKKAFSEYGIPYFLDEKKSLKYHPLSRFLLDCFRTVKENYSPAAVQALASNYFFGRSDEYRNYLYKFANYRGGAKKPIKQGETVEKAFRIETLEEGRTRVLLATEEIKSKAKGREYCRAVRNILQAFEAEKKLESLDNALEDVAQKGYLSQIYRALDSVLLEAEGLMGGKEMTVSEFAAVLEDGFDAMEISLIPLKADAVFIGDVAQSRIEKVNVLFAVGMTEAVPQSAGDTAIVSDREIARLAEVKTLLEPTVAEVNLRSRESVGLNLCTFLDKLYLSYPLSSDGSEPAVSEIFRYVDNVFGVGKEKKVPRRKKLEAEDFPYKCSAPTPAIRQMLVEKGEYEAGIDNSLEECSALFTALKEMQVLQEGEFWQSTAMQDFILRGEELFFHDGKISPTSLEGYFQCPFGHFAERGLRLKEREEATVLAVDSGNFIHLLLEKIAPKAKDFTTEAELRAYAKETGEALLKSSVYMLQQDTKAGEYSSEKLLKEGVDVAAAAYRQIKNSDFSVEQTEVEIRSDTIIGKVDRLDGTKDYVRIIDYKTGNIDDSATSYYTGQKLQMELYMSELQGDRIPAGVFYFPASVDYVEEDGGRYRMKGFLNGDKDALLAGDTTLKNAPETQKSEHFAAAMKNDARLTKVMDEDTFRSFIEYGTFVARQGIAEIKKGYIAPSPYEGGCKYCKFGGMCGFNREVKAARKENSITPSAIAKIAKEEKGEED